MKTFRVLAPALGGGAAPVILAARISRPRQAIVLALAICALLLGLLPLRPSQLLEVGRTTQAAEVK